MDLLKNILVALLNYGWAYPLIVSLYLCANWQLAVSSGTLNSFPYADTISKLLWVTAIWVTCTIVFSIIKSSK